MSINGIMFYLDIKQKGSFRRIIKDHWHNYPWGLASGALSSFGIIQLFHRVLGFDSFPALATTIKGQPLSSYASNALGGLFSLFLAYAIVKRWKKPPSERLFDFLFFIGAFVVAILLYALIPCQNSE